MKVTLRLPTKDQYAFIELQTEVENAEEAVIAYDDAMSLIKREELQGLTDKEFNTWLDRYLVENTGDSEQYSKMNPEQVRIIQAIKRSLKRIEYNK